MNEHSYFADRISAYHDGYLPEQERELIKRHLETCETCRKALADLEKLDRMVEQQSRLDGGDYWEKSAQRIEQRIAEETGEKTTDIRPSRFSGLGMRIAAVAASFLIIGYIALHESDILPDLPDHSPSDQPTMMAPPPVVPDSVVLESDAELESSEPSVELLDAEMDEVLADVPAAKRGAPDKKGAGDKREPMKVRAAAPAPQPVPDEADVRLPIVSDDAVESEPAVRQRAIPPERKSPTPTIRIDDAKVRSADERAGLGMTKAMQEPDKIAGMPGQADLVVASQERAMPPAEADRLTQAVDTTLARWREIRDQNAAAYPQIVSGVAAAFRADADKSKADRQRSTVDSGLVPDEELLLRAWYQIALMTDDPGEKAEAMGFFERYLENENARFFDQAEDYLEKLREVAE